MTEETEILVNPTNGSGDSSFAGVSVRAWLAIILVVTVCISHIMISAAAIMKTIKTGDITMLGTLTTIGEPLYSMSVAALGFYFGQKSLKP